FCRDRHVASKDLSLVRTSPTIFIIHPPHLHFAWQARQNTFAHFAHGARHVLQTPCTRSSQSSSGCAGPKHPSHHGYSSAPNTGFQCSLAIRSAFLRISRTEISCTGRDRTNTSPACTRILSEYFRARSSSLALWSSSVAAARLRSFSCACASPPCRSVL